MTMSSKLAKAKQSLSSFFTGKTFLDLYERIRWRNMSRKRRIYFIVLITVIPSIIILLGLLLPCIMGVDYLTTGIALNRSTQRFGSKTYTNQITFISLANTMKKFPSGFFQISFNNERVDGATNFPSINVRTIEGTPLKVVLFVTGKLNVTDYHNFYRKYGDNWMEYLRHKIPNAITRSVSTLGFYELTSQAIRSLSSSSLSSFDEFSVTIVSVRVELPSQFLSNVNGTLGWNVFQKQAQLMLLNQSLYELLTFGDTATISQAYQSYGTLLATRDALILNNSLANAGIQGYWVAGMTALNSLIPSSDALFNNTLWYYFQSYYNSTFNPQVPQVQFS